MKSRDTVRLDWLTRVCGWRLEEVVEERAYFPRERKTIRFSRPFPEFTGRTPRQAIDAAMKAEREAGS